MRITFQPETPEEALRQAPITFENVSEYAFGARILGVVIPGNRAAFPIVSIAGDAITALHGLKDIELQIMGLMQAQGIKRLIRTELEIAAADAKQVRNGGGKSRIITS